MWLRKNAVASRVSVAGFSGLPWALISTDIWCLYLAVLVRFTKTYESISYLNAKATRRSDPTEHHESKWTSQLLTLTWPAITAAATRPTRGASSERNRRLTTTQKAAVRARDPRWTQRPRSQPTDGPATSYFAVCIQGLRNAPPESHRIASYHHSGAIPGHPLEPIWPSVGPQAEQTSGRSQPTSPSSGLRAAGMCASII